MLTYYVLTLICLTCQPMQIFELHHIPTTTGSSATWADLECRELGDILSGDYARRNMISTSFVGKIAARKDLIIYSCTQESDDL